MKKMKQWPSDLIDGLFKTAAQLCTHSFFPYIITALPSILIHDDKYGALRLGAGKNVQPTFSCHHFPF